MSKRWIYRLKSINSGLTRRNRVSKEYAAYKQPQQKSPGLKPRNERSQYGSKHNVSLELSSYEHSGNALNESYDSFVIAKRTGYGTFMTAQDLGIKIKGGFSHHPSVEEEIKDKKDKACVNTTNQ